jgi:hypothetical protein
LHCFFCILLFGSFCILLLFDEFFYYTNCIDYCFFIVERRQM